MVSVRPYVRLSSVSPSPKHVHNITWASWVTLKYPDLLFIYFYRRDEEPARGDKKRLYPSPTQPGHTEPFYFSHTSFSDAEEGTLPTFKASSSLEILSQIHYESIMVYDALLLLADTVKSMSFRVIDSDAKVSCDSERPWNMGSTLFNYLNVAQVEGLTGKLSFQVREV